MEGPVFRVEGPGFGVEDLDVKLAQQLLPHLKDALGVVEGVYMPRTAMGF